MKILSITVGGREIVKSALDSPMMLIGRSPTCDIVLRMKNVRPVHFLLEWVGVGEFSPGAEGAWTVFDISGSARVAEKHYKSISSGEGLVIDEKPVAVGGFEFCIRTDRLMATHLEGGALFEGFHQKKMQAYSPAQTYQLEVVSVRRDSGFLTHVVHMNEVKGANRRVTVPHIPAISAEWTPDTKGVLLQVDTSRIKDSEIFPGKSALLAGKAENVNRARLVPNELVQIRWQTYDHYFRMVPRIDVPPAPRALFKDPFYRWAAAVALLMCLLFYLVRNMDLIPPEKIPPPPRIAKIEIKNVDIKDIPEPSEPLKPKDVKQEAVNTAPKVPDNKQASSPHFESAKEKNSAGLNSPSAHANVNSIGLLGALRPQKSAVTADKVLNDGLISKTVSRPDGQFTVQQAPAGNLAANQSATKANLAAAYTTMDKADSQAGETVGTIADGDALKPTKAYTNAGVESNGEFSTEGGLDKEAVRKALLAYRKDFRTCYEQALMQKPKITGRIVYKWQISPEGTVSWVNLMSSSVDSPSLATCVQKVIKVIPFPKAPNHQATDVIYPFVFQTKS